MWDRVLSFWLTDYKRVWRGTVISGLLGPLFFLGALGFGLGSLVDDGPAGGVDGMRFVTFVSGGILAAQAMQTAIGESTFPVLGALKWHRFYYAQLATPVGVRDVLAGHLAFVAMRIAMTTTAFLLVAALLGAFESWWVLLAWPVAVLGGLAFATPVFAFSATQQDAGDGFNLLFRFVAMPLFLFSGTFFPIDQLPVGFEIAAWLAPLAHTIAVCRDLALGSAELLPSLGHVAYLGVWIVVGYAVALRNFRKRLIK
jgi:lipooligosaccharide transport system permease protein